MQKGEQAERTFVQSNLRLVVTIAKGYANRGLGLQRANAGGSVSAALAAHEAHQAVTFLAK